ncbi:MULTISPECIES: hypothetical protein [unclassified Streptomyces]|uniref:hypothetical protein n=1 Tax=unclassified Streptomyces TaxID=2593676 RepID=UPI0010DDB67E|nr:MULTISPECIES: hypothetical protein [unclassified Streptomyces]TDU69210.1 hypothetical protein EDD91_7872 [Streptomyces sp. KS 21]
MIIKAPFGVPYDHYSLHQDIQGDIVLKITMLRRAAVTTATASFLLGGLAVAAPASAAPGGSHTCSIATRTANKWTAHCTVTSGQARAVTKCSNGKTIYGAWVGRGRWTFAGECGVYWVKDWSSQGRA